MRAAAVCPVPIRGTETDFTPVVLDETVRMAVAAPEIEGVKMTSAVQLAPAGKAGPQVLAPSEKLAADWPVI